MNRSEMKICTLLNSQANYNYSTESFRRSVTISKINNTGVN